MDAGQVAERFGLGTPTSQPIVAAAGWGQRNRVWRLETTNGVFAVKDTVPELLPAHGEIALQVELAAHAAGIPCPEPMVSTTGAAFEQLNGRWYRCHRWVDGFAKQNEDTDAQEARAMGVLVAALHGLRFDAGPLPPTRRFGRSHWLELARRSTGSRWAETIVDRIDAIDAAEALGMTFDDVAPVGSHADLNAHNVLFSGEGLVLVDWDAAGPASSIYERASTGVLWARRRDGRLDPDIASAFLAGYRYGGGVISRDDVDALARWLAGVAWWTERNVQIALTQPSEKHDELASLLVNALAAGADTLAEQQRFLAAAIEGV